MGDWALPGYSEVRELGKGGFGRVVLARHDASGAHVAIKYLTADLLADQRFVSGFRAEARILRQLDSPHIARLYDFVESGQGAAIVMEAVDGIALRELLERDAPLEPQAALAVLKGSLLGLGTAHERGVVHRDYKPPNVLVQADGQSKLIDFGIALRSGQSGEILGTPPYMAPEQWQGAPAAAATDVYAATCVFFECVTGHTPFQGDTAQAYRSQHTNARVPLHELPEAVRGLVARGMAKHPAERPAGAAAFVTELDRVAADAYGPDWESDGWRRLAEAAAGLAALFPLAAILASGSGAPVGGFAAAGAAGSGAAAGGSAVGSGAAGSAVAGSGAAGSGAAGSGAAGSGAAGGAGSGVGGTGTTAGGGATGAGGGAHAVGGGAHAVGGGAHAAGGGAHAAGGAGQAGSVAQGAGKGLLASVGAKAAVAIAGAVVVGSAGTAVVVASRGGDEHPAVRPTRPAAAAQPLTVNVASSSRTLRRGRIMITRYVQVSGLKDPAVQAKVNKALRAPVDQTLAQFKTAFVTSSGDGFSAPTGTLESAATVGLGGPKLLSVTYTFADSSDANREIPASSLVTVVLDLATGRALGVTDLLLPTARTVTGARGLARILDPQGNGGVCAPGRPLTGHDLGRNLGIAPTVTGITFTIRNWIDLGCPHSDVARAFDVPYARLGAYVRPELAATARASRAGTATKTVTPTPSHS
ncbi:serine/threonine-protein kinase [Actinoallomurus rhizosphaericola]|uniref:serine/threonine-protein kinase n=1 Tax=Actinoallomurus rhizosphaericola TaxID=2952536 RepID=UPI002091C280|nr:serine/threonine-protein kinase [Actinoallomurus rhizosphaericola]MCO5992529.1 serine/threonine protein kinase [Actinoallomurus rhizosphaericola]